MLPQKGLPTYAAAVIGIEEPSSIPLISHSRIRSFSLMHSEISYINEDPSHLTPTAMLVYGPIVSCCEILADSEKCQDLEVSSEYTKASKTSQKNQTEPHIVAPGNASIAPAKLKHSDGYLSPTFENEEPHPYYFH